MDKKKPLSANCKLNRKQVKTIINQYLQGMTQIQLARLYNVSPTAIRQIVKNRSWKKLDIDPQIRQDAVNAQIGVQRTVSESERKELLRLINKGFSVAETAKAIGFSAQTVYKYRKGANCSEAP